MANKARASRETARFLGKFFLEIRFRDVDHASSLYRTFMQFINSRTGMSWPPQRR